MMKLLFEKMRRRREGAAARESELSSGMLHGTGLVAGGVLDGVTPLTSYLIGELSEKEEIQLEERFVTDGSFFQELLAAEDDLIDLYVRGELAPDQAKRFEDYFLKCPSRLERVEFAREFLKARPAGPQGGAERSQVIAQGARQSSSTLSQSLRRFALPLGAVAAALLFCWSLLDRRQLQTALRQAESQSVTMREAEQRLRSQLAESQRQQQDLRLELEKEQKARRQIEEQLTAPEGQIPTIMAVLLRPGGVRGSGDSNTVVIRTGTSRVRLDARLDRDDYGAYQAVLRTAATREVFRKDSLAPQTRGSSRFVRVAVPAHLLGSNDYILTLRAHTADGNLRDIADYVFTVERR